MKNNDILNVHVAVVAIAVATIFVGNSSSVLSQELMTQKALPLDMALVIAQGALEQCRADGSHVSVTVVDGSGLPKVFMRDDRSGPHTIDRVSARHTRRSRTRGLRVNRPSIGHHCPHRHLPSRAPLRFPVGCLSRQATKSLVRSA